MNFILSLRLELLKEVERLQVGPNPKPQTAGQSKCEPTAVSHRRRAWA